MVVRTKKKDYIISDVKKGFIQDKAKLIYSALTRYEGKTVGVDEFCEYGKLIQEIWSIAYTNTFLAVDYLEHLNNRLTGFFERIGRIDLHCKILSIISLAHKSIHELRYSVNQERDFKEFKNTLTEIILCDVNDILKGSKVEYLGVELCDNCVQVIISNGTVLTRFNIFYDDVINSMNKFIKKVKEYDELKKWEIVDQCKKNIYDEYKATEILICEVAEMVEDTDTRLGTGFGDVLDWIIEEYLLSNHKTVYGLNTDELHELKDQLHRLIKYVQGKDI